MFSDEEFIPGDHSRQISIEYYVNKIIDKSNDKTYSILDLGCGEGNSFAYFSKNFQNVEWHGIDVEVNPAITLDKEINKRFIKFDGINIPFQTEYFDIIYCRQVFEHVRYPKDLLKDVYRVLKRGGFFVGSTSQLEPYHAFSFRNYTPYGFNELLKENRLNVIEIRPSIDAFTLIIRRGLGCPKFFDIFWKIESPLNLLISIAGKLLWKSQKYINSLKLLFCGHFVFLSKKSDEGMYEKL